jgi:hypothetical protein
VADRAAVKQLAQRAVLDVGERVVGHQPLGHDAVVEEEDQGPLRESGDGGGAFVGVQLAVGQARAVIDDRVAVLPANAP